MSRLNRLTGILHVQIKSQFKNDLTIVTWSRGFTTQTNPNERLSDGPIKCLQDKINAGELKTDEHQTKVMDALRTLYDTIQTYEPADVSSQSSLFKWLSIKTTKSKNNAPKGLYIYGSVGGGKTTLMDLFYDSCTTVRLTYQIKTKNENCLLDNEKEANPFQFIYDKRSCSYS